MSYVYFICVGSYSYSRLELTSKEVKLEKKITSIKDIREIEKSLWNQGTVRGTIINYQFLRTED